MKRRAESDVMWAKALRAELAIVRAQAKQPRPKGVSRETWDGLLAPYRREILLLRAMLRQLD
jgi:hypothetical protein